MKPKYNYNNCFLIPIIKVKAPLSFKKVYQDGKMPDPDSPDDVVMYDFTFFPGFGGQVGKYGNTVFSGHVDSGFMACDFGKTPPPCMAVLWNLDRLKKGDLITIKLNNKIYQYETLSNRKIEPNGNKLIDNLKTTDKEIITIITCEGQFNSETHKYKQRRVVKAIRINSEN